MTTQIQESLAEVAGHLRAAAQALPALDPQDAPALQMRANLGRCLLSAGDAETALGLAETLADAVPDHPGVGMLRIDAAVAAGNPAAALTALDAGRAGFADEAAFLRRKLTLLRALGQEEEALSVLRALVQVAPDDLARLLELGRHQLSQGHLTEAQQAFLRVLAKDRENAPAWLGRLDVALAEKDLELAAQVADQAAAALPENSSVVTKAARILMQAGRLDAARARLEAVVAEADTPVTGAAMTLALVLRELGAYADSDAAYAKILDTEPDNRDAWIGRIQTALTQGDVDRALGLTGTAMERCPDVEGLMRLRAGVLQRAGRDGEAAASLEVLHKQTPSDSGVALALAGAYRQAGRLEEADALFVAILEQEPDNWSALQGRVGIAEARGDLETAIRLLDTGGAMGAGASGAEDVPA